LATNVYRWAPSGKLEVVVTEEPVPDPNGIPFSPDHKKICHHQHGRGIQVATREASALARSDEQNRLEIVHTDVKYIFRLG
jgi:sugar lactone lactonase YvrE